MRLQPGTRLGSYEVVSELGAGGMGEVYRAKDLKLGRSVAVKLLRTEEALTSDRLRRFEREARAASALSHPNIATIHEVGEHEGTPYIATGTSRPLTNLHRSTGHLSDTAFAVSQGCLYFAWVEDLGDIWVMDVATDASE